MVSSLSFHPFWSSAIILLSTSFLLFRQGGSGSVSGSSFRQLLSFVIQQRRESIVPKKINHRLGFFVRATPTVSLHSKVSTSSTTTTTNTKDHNQLFHNNPLKNLNFETNLAPENSKNDDRIGVSEQRMSFDGSSSTTGMYSITKNGNELLSSPEYNFSPKLDVRHIQDRPISSTQDEARHLLHERSRDPENSQKTTPNYLLVIADQQTSGRGTNGRTWESGIRIGHSQNTTSSLSSPNLFMTLCIPMDSIPVMITLLPLKIGAVVAQRIDQIIQSCHHAQKYTLGDSKGRLDNAQPPSSSETTAAMKLQSSRPKVTVKWPNDVLINDDKVSGTLIENEIVSGETWLLIGIGVNIATSPSLKHSPGRHLRKPCCIQDFCSSSAKDKNNNALPIHTSVVLGIDIASALVDWIVDSATFGVKKDRSLKYAMEQSIVKEWKSFAVFHQLYELRENHHFYDNGANGRSESNEEDCRIDDNNKKYDGSNNNLVNVEVGEMVRTLDIQDDGQLIVRSERDGKIRTLVTDYLH